MATSKFNMGEFLSKRTKTEKILGFAAALFLFIAVMQGLVLGPILQKIKEIDLKIETTATFLTLLESGME